MAESFSQNELDSILTAFEDQPPSAPSEEPTSTKRVVPYDFSHPDLLSRDQVRSIQTLHEGYAQALAKKLSTDFLSNVSASVVSVDHLTYGEFLVLLPRPTVLAVIEVEQLGGNIAIELNPSIAFTFVDRTLGGIGTPLQKMRALTAIEQGLMERVFSICCNELEMIWAPFQDLDFQVQSIEGNPELARVIDLNEMAVLVSLEIKMNDVSGMMNLCLPYVVMETSFQRLSQGGAHQSKRGPAKEAVREQLEESVQDCDVDVHVDLGSVDLSVREVLDLEVGDVLRIRPGSPWGAMGSVEGSPRIAGVPGRSRGNKAFEVREVHPVAPEEGKGSSG